MAQPGFTTEDWRQLQECTQTQDWGGMLALLDAMESRPADTSLDPRFHAAIAGLRETVEYLASPNAKNTQPRHEVCMAFLETAEDFTVERAGRPAVVAFRHFRRAYAEGDYGWAMNYRDLTNSLRACFVEERIAAAQVTLRQAGELRRERRFREADSVLQALVFDPGSNRRMAVVADSLRMAHERIATSVDYIELKEASWEQTDERVFAWRLGVVGGITSRSSLGVTNFDLMAGAPYESVLIEEIGGHAELTLGAEALRLVAPRLYVGAGVNLERHHVTNSQSPHVDGIDLDFNLLSVRGLIRYHLRERVGLQPFVAIGIGHCRYEYKDVQASVLEFAPEGGRLPVYYEVVPYEYSSLEYVGQFGIDFIASAKQRLIVGARLFVVSRAKDDAILGRSTAGIKLSVHLGS
jgi:hypothetical protein